MSSVKCNLCGMVCWAGAEACKGCGNPLGATTQHNYHYGHATGGPAFAPGGGQTKKRTGLAIASLVIGIISIPTLGLLGFGAFVGIGLGIAALLRAKQQPSEFGGQGLAIGGIVASVLSLALVVPIGIVAAIAIPNLLASRRAANEASALRTIRLLAEAESIFQSSTGVGKFGDLSELEAANLVDAKLAKGFLNSYYFNVTPLGESFEVSASPVKYPSDGTRSFYLSSSEGIVRAVDKRGLPADATDPPLPEFIERRGVTRPNSNGSVTIIPNPEVYPTADTR